MRVLQQKMRIMFIKESCNELTETIVMITITIIIILHLFSWQSATDIQQAATQDSTDTIEHKEPAIIQPNIATRISMGGNQLQASAKVYHNAVN